MVKERKKENPTKLAVLSFGIPGSHQPPSLCTVLFKGLERSSAMLVQYGLQYSVNVNKVQNYLSRHPSSMSRYSSREGYSTCRGDPRAHFKFSPSFSHICTNQT